VAAVAEVIDHRGGVGVGARVVRAVAGFLWVCGGWGGVGVDEWVNALRAKRETEKGEGRADKRDKGKVDRKLIGIRTVIKRQGK
jgi:hypothetical protein